MFCLSENIETLQYVAALALYDGCFSMRPRRYEVIIADMNREFLEKICHDLKDIGISCGVHSSKRDKAYRLRIYGKDVVQQLNELAINLLRNPNDVLLAAAIDAEGNIGMYRNQPFRTRIVMKEGEKIKCHKRSIKKARDKLQRIHTLQEKRSMLLQGDCDKWKRRKHENLHSSKNSPPE